MSKLGRGLRRGVWEAKSPLDAGLIHLSCGQTVLSLGFKQENSASEAGPALRETSMGNKEQAG